MSDSSNPQATEPLRDPRVKVWPVSRIVVVSIIYVALATGGAWLSMGVAMDRVTDMGHYQVEKTREFLGNQRAKELEEYMHPTQADGNAAEGGDVDAEAAGIEAADGTGAEASTD
jgi:hypothetical protein